VDYYHIIPNPYISLSSCHLIRCHINFAVGIASLSKMKAVHSNQTTKINLPTDQQSNEWKSTDEQKNEPINRRTEERTNQPTNRRTNQSTDEQKNESINRRTEERINQPTNRRTNQSTGRCHTRRDLQERSPKATKWSTLLTKGLWWFLQSYNSSYHPWACFSLWSEVRILRHVHTSDKHPFYLSSIYFLLLKTSCNSCSCL
jgi:hypothetical protein